MRISDWSADVCSSDHRDRLLIADVIRSRGERANALGAAQLDAGEKARFATVCCGTIHQRHPFARSVWLVAGSEPPRKAEASAAAANIVPGPASDRIWGDFTRDSVLIIFFSRSEASRVGEECVRTV